MFIKKHRGSVINYKKIKLRLINKNFKQKIVNK